MVQGVREVKKRFDLRRCSQKEIKSQFKNIQTGFPSPSCNRTAVPLLPSIKVWCMQLFRYPVFMRGGGFFPVFFAGLLVCCCVSMDASARLNLNPCWNSLCCLLCILCTLTNLSKQSPSCPSPTTRDPLVEHLTDTCSKLTSHIHFLQSANTELISCLQTKVRRSKQTLPLHPTPRS